MPLHLVKDMGLGQGPRQGADPAGQAVGLVTRLAFLGDGFARAARTSVRRQAQELQSKIS